METFRGIVELAHVVFLALVWVFVLGMIASHWRAEFRAPRYGDERSPRSPTHPLLERRVGDVDVAVTWRSATSFVPSSIRYDVRWSSETASVNLVRNPLLDRMTAMIMPVTSHLHPDVGTAVPHTSIARLRTVDTPPQVVRAWLTPEREAAIATLLTGPNGRADETVRLACSNVGLCVSVTEGRPGEDDHEGTIRWLLDAVHVLRGAAHDSLPTAGHPVFR